MKEMPSLLIQNLQILEKSQPKLVSMLRQYADGVTTLREPAFQQTAGGRWVSGLAEAPFFEKEQLLEKRPKLAPSPVYLVFGAGCAPYLFHVLRSLPREALSIVVFEPSFDILLHTMSQTSLFQAAPSGSRLSFIVNDDTTLIDEALAWNIVPIGMFPVRNALSIIHPGEEQALNLGDLEKRFHEEVRYRLNMLGNSPEDTLLGFRHAALNIRHILGSSALSDVRALYVGNPFVCVASGPSLVKNVHLLDEIKDKCVIVACDTVLHHLLERGIVPHAVTTLERAYSNYPAWVPAAVDDFPEECEKILLLSQSVSYPLISGRWPGPNVVVGKREVPVDNWFVGGVIGGQLMYSGLSVAHMSLSFALLCGASSVALIGQDLAYAEEGHSHAPNTAPLSAVKREEERGRFPTEAALGGTVLTNHMWKSFIQLFERVVAGAHVPVSDCTEGGALIKGTKVVPFSTFINENVMISDVLCGRYEKTESRKHIVMKNVLDKIEQTVKHFDLLEERLRQVEKGVDSTVAPALLPERRRQAAFHVAELLDGIHGMNPVISFIGQSYTHLSGATLAEARFLENVEDVHKWEALHREMLLSHRSALAFLRQWTQYVRELLTLLHEDENADWKTAPGCDCESLFVEKFDQWLGLPPQELKKRELFILLTDLLSDADPLRESWNSDSLWKAAKLLHIQGRHDDARRCMQKGYDLLEGQSLPVAAMGAYFKEWAAMTGSPDLCVMTNFREALVYLDNAVRCIGNEDPEILSLRDTILSAQQRLYDNAAGISSSKTNADQVYLLSLINKAERALLEQDLPRALATVEELVLESWESAPGTAIPHLAWLLKTSVDCLEAADKHIVAASKGILERAIARLPRWKERRIELPREFLLYMQKSGIKFALETSDNEEGNG